jgi:hypothetical protein
VDTNTQTNESTAIHRKMMLDPQFTFQDQYVIQKLIEFKARTKTICSILKNSSVQISESDIGRLYKNAHGIASGRGLESYSPDRMIGSHERVYHASFYVILYRKLLNIHNNVPMAHVEAYKEYLFLFDQTIEDPVLSFTLAYRICQFSDTGSFVYVPCRECKLKFIHLANTPVSSNSCPCCTLIRRRTKPVFKDVSLPKVVAVA